MSAETRGQREIASMTEMERLVEVARLLGSLSTLAWTVQRFGEYRDGLMAHSPFQPGDRVILAAPPRITERDSWGWMAHRHYLVKGAVGTVREIDWSGGADGHFRCAVEFDGESWIDPKGEERAVSPERRGWFWMEARRFDPADERAVRQATTTTGGGP